MTGNQRLREVVCAEASRQTITSSVTLANAMTLTGVILKGIGIDAQCMEVFAGVMALWILNHGLQDYCSDCGHSA